MPAKKNYVLDTSVYLTDADSIRAFKNNEIVIPLKVLEEIDKHKKRQDGVGLKARMVIRDGGRVLGFPYGFVDSISKMIPFDPSRPLSLIECINSEPRFQKLINDDSRVKKLTDLSLKLEGLNRNIATHAAGVVIADKKLTEIVPLYKDSSANL